VASAAEFGLLRQIEVAAANLLVVGAAV